MKRLIALLPLVLILGKSLAQDNYEIQVYGSETMDKHCTMLELHSNFTNNGSTAINKGVLPTNHVDHETIEITHGWNDWFETNSVLNDKKGRKFVCNSISFEVAQQTKTFSHVKNNVVCPDYL